MKKVWIISLGLLLAFAGAILMAKGKVYAKGPEIGKAAPDFTLTDIKGKLHSLADYKGKYVVLEWTNYQCPFVKKHYNTNNMQNLQKKFGAQEVVWLSICSSAEGKQGHFDSATWNTQVMEKGASPHAVLLDSKGKVGRLYAAKTTPHMFVISPKGELLYKGAIDDRSTADPDDVQGAHNYVWASLEESMSGKAVTKKSVPSYGCSVKY